MNSQMNNSFTLASNQSTVKVSRGSIPHDNCDYSSSIRHDQSSHSPITNFDSVPLIGPIIPMASNKGSGITHTTSVLSGNQLFDSMKAAADLAQPLSRLQEKEELQRLNDRFLSYVARVRHLGHQGNNVDSSAFLRSTKVLEDEITSLKNMYQAELDKLRNEIEAGAYEKNSLHAQCNQQHKYIGELQDRLTIETDRNSNLLDEINMLQRRIGNLEGAVQDAHIAARRPQEELDQLQRSVEELSREVDQWKNRCEQEHVANQQGGERLQQIMMKAEFSEQVQNQQIMDYQNRLDTATANIISLEARVRELSATDLSVGAILKQVRDTAEAELTRYQMESEEQFNRNLSTLKTQIDSDGSTIQRLSEEKSGLAGCVAELQAKVRSLEGQVTNLQHQKRVLEDTVNVERSRAADSILQLEKKLRDAQDMLISQMFELSSARESSVPLKVEIEALKALLEEEEKRLRAPLVSPSASGDQPRNPNIPTVGEILKANPLSSFQASTYSHLQAPVVRSYDQSFADSRKAGTFEASSPLHQYNLYDYNNTSYLPGNLNSVEEHNLAFEEDYEAGLADDDRYRPEAPQGPPRYFYEAGLADDDRYRPEAPQGPPRYFYEASPSLSRLHVEPSVPGTPRALGPIQSRAQSAPVKCGSDAVETNKVSEKKAKKKKWNYIPSNFGSGRDYFEEMFYDLQNKSLYSKPRPKSSPLERRMPSSFHDYTVATFSATGDLKIQEVNEDGKYVRLLNDGTRELDIGGYIIRQNVNGRAEAIFKFPPHTHFPPNATITVWTAMNDPKLDNPPTDFFWSEREKWETGPEASTILCRSNGQAVAWTTAAHRHTRRTEGEASKTKSEKDEVNNQADRDNIRTDDVLTEESIGSLNPKLEPANLKREKRQPRHLAGTKVSNGSGPPETGHPQTKCPQSAHLEGTLHNHLPKCQTVPDQIQPGGHVQRVGGMPLMMSNASQRPRPPTIRGNGTLVNKQAGSIQKGSGFSYMSSTQDNLIHGPRKEISLAS